MTTQIKVHGDRSVITILDGETDEGEAAYTWGCSLGHETPRGYSFHTLADVINDAEVHLERQCEWR